VASVFSPRQFAALVNLLLPSIDTHLSIDTQLWRLLFLAGVMSSFMGATRALVTFLWA